MTLPACTHHRVIAEPMPAAPELMAPPLPDAVEPAGMLPVAKRSVVASLRRTACFGSCPVFSVEIWSDGQVIWQGERHVARIGR
ncbi:MAG: DUF6438 domain-containing protein, partial [Saprospiraceae bacterium]